VSAHAADSKRQLSWPSQGSVREASATNRYKNRYKRALSSDSKKRNCPRDNNLRHAGSQFSGEDRRPRGLLNLAAAWRPT